MHSQHNPIAQRIDEMRRVWNEKISERTVLVRWLLKPEESRMYEGFCRLEASPHGNLNELFVFFYTPFEDAATYSRDIIKAWIEEIKKQSSEKEAVAKAGISINEWDYKKYEDLLQKEPTDCNALLIDFMTSYRQLLSQTNVPLVLCLLPQKMASIGSYAIWIKTLMEQVMPEHLRLLVFDHTEGNYLGGVFEKFSDRSVTLHHDLRLDEAMRQIATGGNPQNPEVQFRKCMYEMGDAAQKNSLSLLHQWGKKGIEVGTKSGQKTLLATAYITYAGMLFSFKEHETIHSLLDSGLRICKREIASGDESMKPLLLQFCGFKGASYQQQKKTEEALEWFIKQGKEAVDFSLFTQSVSAYYKAFLLAQFKGLVDEQVSALTAALSVTSHLHDEEARLSEYPYIAYDYIQMAERKTPGTNTERAAIAEHKMQAVFGEDWKATVEKMKLNFNKQHIQMMEAKAVVME